MKAYEREGIVKGFIDLHDNDDLQQWLLPKKTIDTIFNELVDGVFGQINSDSYGYCRIEISKYESKSGQTEEFFFQLDGDEWHRYVGTYFVVSYADKEDNGTYDVEFTHPIEALKHMEKIYMSNKYEKIFFQEWTAHGCVESDSVYYHIDKGNIDIEVKS